MDIYTALVLLIGAAVLLYICHLFLGVCRCSESPPLLPQHRDQGGARADHYHRSNYVTAALPTTRPSGYGVHQTSPRPNQLPNEQVHTAWRPSAQANLRAAEFAAAAERQKVKAEEWRVAEARRVAEAQRVAEVHRVAEAQRVFWYQEESARARRRESEEQERADGLLLWKAEQVKREAELVRLAKEDTRRRKEAKGKEVSRKGEEERLKKARLDGFRQQGEIDALEARVATAEDPDQLPKSTQVKPPRTRPARKVKSTSPKALASKQPPFYHRNTIHQSDPYYIDLRRRANDAGHAMALSFDAAAAARQQGERGLAMHHSAAGAQRRDEMEQLNAQASAWIFVRNNKNSPVGSVDLHGLYVNEACYYVTLALENAPGRSITNFKFIVGRGKHSVNGVAKIKPAIEELLRSRDLAVVTLPRNPGVLVVQLQKNDQVGDMKPS